MTKKIFINGASGRIGNGVTHEYFTNPELSDLEIVAMNDPAGIDKTLEVYTGNDPVHGVYDWNVKKTDDNTLVINGKPVRFFSNTPLSQIPFAELGIDLVMECSGFYGDPKDKKDLTPADNPGREFLKYGVQRVIETYPAKTADASLIMGCNHLGYNPAGHRVVSNASCTTKSLALPLQVLLDNGIVVEALSMDTVHAETGKDLHKLAGLLNPDFRGPTPKEEMEKMFRITTHSTGAAKATGLVIPSLNGKMVGGSYRVPALDGSFSNLYFVATSEKELSQGSINDLMRNAVTDPKYAGRIGIFEEKDIGTSNIVGRRENGVVALSKTSLLKLPFAPNGKHAYLVTMVSGYDNELGSAVDPCLLAKYILSR